MDLESPHRPVFSELPLGQVRPQGWLASQLRLQASGLTGHLEEIWDDVGPNSAWLGGSGEDWERGPYYLDGMLPLAYLLQDEALLSKSKVWVEALLSSQGDDGQFGPPSNSDWWPRIVALKALTQYADATGDVRVQAFMTRFCAYWLRELPQRPLTSWGRMRGADGVLSVMWLHERSGDPALLELSRLLLTQTADWQEHLTAGLSWEPTRTFDHLNHGPNVAMGLKTEAVRALVDGGPSTDRDRSKLTDAMFANLNRRHGMVHGVFSGDEWIAGRDPHHGVETCQVVELMFTLEQLVRIHGDGQRADDLELAAFNLLPASCDPRMLSHQYHQQANQIRVSVDRRDWTYSGDDANIFGLEPHFGCCTANMHQGWPKFVRSLWMATQDGGLAALSYAPCSIDAQLSTGTLQLSITGAYPFEETVRIEVTGGGGNVPLRLRIPAWCTTPRATLGGEALDVTADEHGFFTVHRVWHVGDALELLLPMTPRIVPRDRGAVGVRVGPLVMVASPGETWRAVPDAPGLAEWEITPRRTWNLGLASSGVETPVDWSVTRTPVTAVPFTLNDAPVRMKVSASQVPEWLPDGGSAGLLPESPVSSDQPVETVHLVPYGNARLRISEFPVVTPNSGVNTP